MIFNRCCSIEVNNVTVLRLIADVRSLLGCLIVVNVWKMHIESFDRIGEAANVSLRVACRETSSMHWFGSNIEAGLDGVAKLSLSPHRACFLLYIV
ncbi:hypothetical protein Hanom_Chr10g00951581 [Helianthus anomalus]